MFKSGQIILLLLALTLMACAPSMTDEAYEEISEEFADRLAINMIETEDFEFDEDYEYFFLETLEEVTEKHNYTATDFINKAEQTGDGLEAVFERVGNRVLEILDEIEAELDRQTIEEETEEIVEDIE